MVQGSATVATPRRLRGAIVGGGRGSFIGGVHMISAALDDEAEWVAGAMSSDPEVARESAREKRFAEDRCYGSWEEMIKKEAEREQDRIDWISIVTPNHAHFDPALAAIKAGFNVVCDKPLTISVAQAVQLADAVEEHGVVFAVTHNYTGYPLVRQAREMVLSGELGEINALRATYIQGWLRTRIEKDGQKQASWRTDPRKSGAAGCFGDIATHAYNLGRYITGLKPSRGLASLCTFEKGRQLDDYGQSLIEYENRALGSIGASQISHGRENDLTIEIDGTKGALSWRQEEPNKMWIRRNGEPHQLYTRDPNARFMTPLGKGACRLPSGHPEAFFEAFANVYRAAFEAMRSREAGEEVEQRDTLYPNVHDGVDGVNFIEQCVASSADGSNWRNFSHQSQRK